MRTNSYRNKAFGFTLVEMITVISIIAILIALVAPALIDVIRSTRLNSAGDALINRISLAQQSAVALSSEVELRFYKYVDSASDRPNDNAYYAYQVVQNAQNGTEKSISEVYYLESGIMLSSDSNLSPLLGATNDQVPSANGQFLFNPPGSASGEDVTYASLRFYPDGSMRKLSVATNADDQVDDQVRAYTVPALAESFFMVIESRDAQSSEPPTNYYCIQIDSYTGKTRVYRP